MKVTVVSVSTSVFGELIEACKYINESYGNILELKLYYVSRDIKEEKLKSMMTDIENGDMSIIDLMGAPDKIVKTTYDSLENSKGQVVIIGRQGREYLKLGSLTSKDMNMKKNKEQSKKTDVKAMDKMINMAEKMGKILPVGKLNHMKNYIHIGKYWNNAQFQDMKNLLYLILRDYGKYKEIPKPLEPVKREDISICHPETMEFFNNYKEYVQKYGFNEERPTVALIFYGHSYPSKTSNFVYLEYLDLKKRSMAQELLSY